MTTFLSKTVADRQYTDALKDDIKGRVKKIEDAITAARACTVRQLKLETCCAHNILSSGPSCVGLPPISVTPSKCV